MIVDPIRDGAASGWKVIDAATLDRDVDLRRGWRRCGEGEEGGKGEEGEPVERHRAAGGADARHGRSTVPDPGVDRRGNRLRRRVRARHVASSSGIDVRPARAS